MPAKLERFIENVRQATTLEALEAVVCDLRELFEVEHVAYLSVGSADRRYAALTYPAAWVQRYIAQGYARIDPVVQGCLRRFHPVDWKCLDWSGRTARDFWAEAVGAGVGNQGFTVPIHGPGGQFALFTVSDRVGDTEWGKFTNRNANDLILVAHFISQKAFEFGQDRDAAPVKLLSRRENDAMTALARGLNRAQASEYLSISEHTLRVYLESARVKLGAANTLHAVARALAGGHVLL